MGEGEVIKAESDGNYLKLMGCTLVCTSANSNNTDETPDGPVGTQ